MSADLIGPLRQRGEIELDGDGGLHFHGEAGRLYRWLDDALERISLAAGATAFVSADTIDRGILETADYFESFADGAIATSEEGTTYLPPAACYQVYPSMRDVRLDAGRHVCVAAGCGRREVRTAEELGRLQRFRMREAVFLGSSDWVSAERHAWMDRVSAFAESIGIAGTLETATDTFFGSEGRGRRLIQQLKNLKYELRVDAGSAGRLAVASFNLHETFFTSRFGIGPMADGSQAVSGCVAFGLERWTLACLARHGSSLAEIDAIVERGVPRFTTNT